MSQSSSKQIVFITGTFISNVCWDEWIRYFESKGYTCFAPAWPHKDAPAEDLRNRPGQDPIASNTITSLTDYFASFINTLPGKPILIGHSLGGLIVQLLLPMDLAVAGVAIHSFPPQGVNRFRLLFLKAMWDAMLLFTSARSTYLVTFRKWKKSIANKMDCDLQKELYYEYAIPESKLIIRDIFRCVTKIDFRKPHVPLLFTSGGFDKLVPAEINYSNYKKYQSLSSVVDYKEFQSHNHLVFGQTAWKREARFIYHWLQGVN
ncbi:MAG: alpha/beta hydrolase [Bacteroidota bacterium]